MRPSIRIFFFSSLKYDRLLNCLISNQDLWFDRVCPEFRDDIRPPGNECSPVFPFFHQTKGISNIDWTKVFHRLDLFPAYLSTLQIGFLDEVAFVKLLFPPLDHDLAFLKDIAMGGNGKGFTSVLLDQ